MKDKWGGKGLKKLLKTKKQIGRNLKARLLLLIIILIIIIFIEG